MTRTAAFLQRRFGCNISVRWRPLLDGSHQCRMELPNPCCNSSRTMQKRSVVTQAVEPPLDSSVPELPCTVCLVENLGCYSSSSSWHPTFCQELPNERGIQYCHLNLRDATSLETALFELERDLATITNNTVLVTRGPLWSWVAQYCLESFPLAGLVMVDPIIHLDNDYNMDSMALYSRILSQSAYPAASTAEDNLLKRMAEGQETRELKLEPGSVPMLMFHSICEPLEVVEAVYRTAERHTAAGLEDAVPVVNLKDGGAKEATSLICDWIDNHVL